MDTRFWIPSLDGIRAIAFLIVFFAHAGLGWVIPGGYGVTVFFFLSGYLITTLLRMEAEQTGQVRLGEFYLRRVLRIFPPFYVVLGTVIVLAAAGMLSQRLDFYPTFAIFTHWYNYYQIIYTRADTTPPGLTIYWSLAVEEHFYLMFAPAYALLLRRFSGVSLAKVFLLVCLAVLAWRYLLVYVWHLNDPPGDLVGVEWNYRTNEATDTRIDSILLGCILGVWKNPVLDRYQTGRLFNWLVLPVAIGVMLFTFVYRSPGFRETARYTLQGLALFPIFIAAIRYHESPLFRPLNWKWVRHIGVLSYTLYLCHYVILHEVHARFHLDQDPTTIRALLLAIPSLILAIVFAQLVHWLIEKPVARLRRKLSSLKARKLPNQ